jgi:hypothetical protein
LLTPPRFSPPMAGPVEASSSLSGKSTWGRS